MALPNLFLRSALTLTLLYGLLGVVLITIVQFGFLTPALAVGIGVAIILLQFLLGPWIMDLSLRFLYECAWVQPEDLPEHLELFVQRVCDENKMRFPSFGIIQDGGPQAFTYGHHPGNARVVISRGLIKLLTPEELEAVVAHELGHACHWDMALMTLANLVPLLLYYIYDLSIRWSNGGDGKSKAPAWVVALARIRTLRRQPVHRSMVQPHARIPCRPFRRSGHRQSERPGVGAGQNRLWVGRPGQQRNGGPDRQGNGRPRRKNAAIAASARWGR